MARTRNEVDWSVLPSDLLSSIAKRLPSRIEVLRLRAVCHNYRTSVPLPPKPLSPYLPLKIPLPREMRDSVCSHFLLTQSTVYAVEPLVRSPEPEAGESSGMWLIRVEERNSGMAIAKSVLNREMSPTENWPKSLNLLDYRVKEVSKDYGLVQVFEHGGIFRDENVFVSVSLDEIDDDFSLMAVLDPGKLVLWRYGDEDWTHVSNVNTELCNRIAYHNGRFFAFLYRGCAIIVDPKSLLVTEIGTPVCERSRCFSLLKSDEDLFLIMKRCTRSYFCCFKLNEEKLKWVLVTDRILDDFVPLDCNFVSLTEGLNDRVLFVGAGYVFSISAMEFSVLRRNCIYFSGSFISCYRRMHRRTYSDDVKPTMVFDLKEKTALPLHAFPQQANIFRPPTWLRLKSSLA